MRELRAGGADLPRVAPAGVLDRDLGLDSLARMELLLRVERRAGGPPPAGARARTAARRRAGGTGFPPLGRTAPVDAVLRDAFTSAQRAVPAPPDVTVCEPIAPPPDAPDLFAVGVRLRDAAYRSIAAIAAGN